MNHDTILRLFDEQYKYKIRQFQSSIASDNAALSLDFNKEPLLKAQLMKELELDELEEKTLQKVHKEWLKELFDPWLNEIANEKVKVGEFKRQLDLLLINCYNALQYHSDRISKIRNELDGVTDRNKLDSLNNQIDIANDILKHNINHSLSQLETYYKQLVNILGEMQLKEKKGLKTLKLHIDHLKSSFIDAQQKASELKRRLN